MPNKLLILALSLVAVRGAGCLRKEIFRSLRSKDRHGNGMTVFLRTEKGDLVPLDLPADATVGTLRTAALSFGVDLGTRQFSFGGEDLSDPSALLSDIGVPAEAVIDASSPASIWNREALNVVHPIFKAEIQVKTGESKIVYLQWDGLAEDDLNERVYIPGKPFIIRMLMVNLDVVNPKNEGQWTDQRLCWSSEKDLEWVDLWQADIVGTSYIKVDFSSHFFVSKFDSDINLRLPCTPQGIVPFSKYLEVKWGIRLTELVHAEQVRI